ncbi:MAG: YeeE/YedE thiosulfate transporter family protein, partial [Pseudomonadota bacterium]
MTQELNLWLIGGGLGFGVLFGIIVQRSRFCVLAAVSNWVLMRDLRQVHGYLAAVAVAVAGTAVLELTGVVPVAESIYRSARVDWQGALAGGAMFGFGVVLAGGCVGRLLVRG